MPGWNFNQNTCIFIQEIYLNMSYAKSLQWRHNGHDSVSNHQPHDCLLSRLFRRRSKKTLKLSATGLCLGNSPHKWPITRKMFPFNYVIMWRSFCSSLDNISNGAMDFTYLKVSNISRTKSKNLNDSRLVLQLSLPSRLKPGVKSRMKM